MNSIKLFLLYFTGFYLATNFAETLDSSKKMKFERETPKSYIEKAIKIFKERNLKNVIEIGSMRVALSHNIDQEACEYCLYGHSTVHWTIALAEVYSVDIDPIATNITKTTCQNYKNLYAITGDGIDFLKKFKSPIDLLFLDAWDVGSPYYAEKHLEAYEAAKDKLHNKSLILIDDTDIDNNGKGKLVIPKAISDGFRVIFTGRQTLLSK